MVRGEKHDVEESIRFLKVFSEAFGMAIKWEKSCTYWFNKFSHMLEWLASYGWKSAAKRELSKLLGTMFGLNLNTLDVDQFPYTKISHKLAHWSTKKQSIIGRVVICYHIVNPMVLYFHVGLLQRNR